MGGPVSGGPPASPVTSVPAAWLRALTLSERTRAAAPTAAAAHPGSGPPRGLDRWKAQAPFDRGDWFVRRLALEGLDEERFARLLETPAGDPGGMRPAAAPRWIEALRDALATPTAPEPDPSEAFEDPTRGFMTFARPFVARARARLLAGARAVAARAAGVPFRPEDGAALFGPSVGARLLPILDRTLVLELNVARLEGRLAGDTPDDRFRSFVALLAGPETRRSLLDEYPVLARAVVETLDAWVGACLEFLARLAADRPRLIDTFFGGEDPGPLAAVEGDAGDPHRGGRTVVIARFASGRRVVYKPRPLAVDAHFQELLAWLEARGMAEPLRRLAVLDRGDYGWMEHVDARGCAGEEEVRRYHRRLGGLLAILHAVAATDIHFENLIACGDQPVPIDLETLFHPAPPHPDPQRADERIASYALSRSVLRIGLLPFRAGESGDFEGIDLSGVASVAGQPSPDRALHWESSGTDEMHAVRLRPQMPGGLNRPTLGGREVEAADYTEEMAAGFERTYRLLQRHRDDLLHASGPLERFAPDEVRVVLRPTRTYGLLLSESFHPDFLRDALDRDRFFDRLWIGVEENPALERVVAAEHASLRAGDIPCFAARADGIDLLVHGAPPVARFFEESALAAARARLASFSEGDLARQLSLLRLSLGTRLLNRDDDDPPPYAPVAIDAARLEDPDAEARLRASLFRDALAVGDWFETTAIRDPHDVTWAGLDFRNRRWSLTTMSEDLYVGAPGIALFLAYLGAVADRPAATGLARGALRTLLRRLEHTGDALRNIGAFQGWGGVVYALAHLGVLCRDEALLDEAGTIASRITALLDRDDDLDVVGGAAGAIAALLALQRARLAAGAPRGKGPPGRVDPLEAARRCGDFLLTRAIDADDGLSWRTRIGGEDPQIGFSHGAAGIGWALAALGAATGEKHFLDAARRTFLFERGVFWPELRRWLGDDPQGRGPRAGSGHVPGGKAGAPIERTVAMAWCYGAPGIGLARLRALDHLATLPPGEAGALREEVAIAARLTAERGFGQNHCLCHGDLGNLDFLAQAAGTPDAPAGLGREVRRWTAVVLGSIARDGWRCGTRAGVLSPGLMNGLAGIGLGLLRLADARRVPSVLVLDPPPVAG
jgi:type 2 lantibiotic biosynthesis protein LanM